MEPAEFERRLSLRLCWRCGVPTHGGGGRQRQCPACRRKWSFVRLQSEWTTACAFCHGLGRAEAAELAGIGPHAAGRHYSRYERELVRYCHDALLLGHGDSLDHTSPEVMRLVDAIEALPPGLARNRAIVRLVFLGRDFHARRALLHRLVFQPVVEPPVPDSGARHAIPARGSDSCGSAGDLARRPPGPCHGT